MPHADQPDFRYKMRADQVDFDWSTHGSSLPRARMKVSGRIISGGGSDGLRSLEVKFTFDNVDGSLDIRENISLGEREFTVPLHPAQQGLVVLMAQAIVTRTPPVTINIWQENGRLNGGISLGAPGENAVGELVAIASDPTCEIPCGTYDIPVGRWWCGAEHYFDGQSRHLRTAYRAERPQRLVSRPREPVISELLVTFDYFGRYEAPRPCAITESNTIMLYLSPDPAFDGVFENIMRQASRDRPRLTARLVVSDDRSMKASVHLEPMAHWPEPGACQ